MIPRPRRRATSSRSALLTCSDGHSSVVVAAASPLGILQECIQSSVRICIRVAGVYRYVEVEVLSCPASLSANLSERPLVLVEDRDEDDRKNTTLLRQVAADLYVA